MKEQQLPAVRLLCGSATIQWQGYHSDIWLKYQGKVQVEM
jgi:hypothetical protein